MSHQTLGTLDFSTDPRQQIVEIDAVAWIIGQFQQDAGDPADHARIHRTLKEAMTLWPENDEAHWWRGIVEAGNSLSLNSRPVDCSAEEIREIVREGGRVLLRVPATGMWIGISGRPGGRRMTVLDAASRQIRQMSWQQLCGVLVDNDAEFRFRSIVFQPALSGGLSGEQHPGGATPLSRTWSLLRAESVDIRIVFVFAIVNGLLALAAPLAIEALVSTVTFGRLLQPIVILSLLLLAFLTFQAAIRGLQTYVAEIIQRRLFARVAADLAYRIPRVTAAALEGRNSREHVNRFFDVVTVQKVTSQLLLDGITVAVNTLVGMAVLGFYHPWLLGFDVVLLAMITFIVLVLGRGAVATSIQESKKKYKVASWLEDLAGCPITFRYDGAPQYALGMTDQLIHDYLTARRRHFQILLRQIVFSLGLQAATSTALLGLGGWLVISGELTLGQLVAAELIVTVIVGSFAKLGKHMESYYDMMAAVDKLGSLLDLPMERQDGMLTLQPSGPAECSLKDVTCKCAAGKTVLNGMNLEIASGDRILLTGGSGKSMLLDLFYGLRNPDHGYLQIDGVDPRQLRPDILRRSVILARDIEVFEGSLLQNIHLERPEVTAEHVHAALRSVDLLGDLLDLPQGLNTKINASGYPLSRNQLRKLILARAIAAQPALLLIDGLLDALPADECENIMQMLSSSTQPWTLLLATSRLRLAQYATREIQFCGH